MPGFDDLLIGRVLDGRYRLDEPIGRGAMGSVYRGTDTRLERPVAVKVMAIQSEDADTHGRNRKRFQREAQSAARLQHPNIVVVHDYGTDPETGFDFLVMELLAGRDLAARLRDAGPIPVAEALRTLQQAADGLAEGHRHGLIHRDVKPGNLFLETGRDGRPAMVKLLDFGIALPTTRPDDETLTRLTAFGQSPATPSYASPEQLRGETPLTPASDIYSLGVVAYQMLAGARPYAPEAIDRLRWGGSVGVTPLRALGIDVPEDVSALIERMMAPDAAARFADAVEFATALRAVRLARIASRVTASSGGNGPATVSPAPGGASFHRPVPHTPGTIASSDPRTRTVDALRIGRTRTVPAEAAGTWTAHDVTAYESAANGPASREPMSSGAASKGPCGPTPRESHRPYEPGDHAPASEARKGTGIGDAPTRSGAGARTAAWPTSQEPRAQPATASDAGLPSGGSELRRGQPSAGLATSPAPEIGRIDIFPYPWRAATEKGGGDSSGWLRAFRLHSRLRQPAGIQPTNSPSTSGVPPSLQSQEASKPLRRSGTPSAEDVRRFSGLQTAAAPPRPSGVRGALELSRPPIPNRPLYRGPFRLLSEKRPHPPSTAVSTKRITPSRRANGPFAPAGKSRRRRRRSLLLLVLLLMLGVLAFSAFASEDTLYRYGHEVRDLFFPREDWLVVLGAYPHDHREDAEERLGDLHREGISDLRLIDTDDYPGLPDGYWALATGPTSRETAVSIADQLAEAGLVESYARPIRSPERADASLDGAFSGEIGDDARLRMFLRTEDGQVEGHYFYTRYRLRATVAGAIDENGGVWLQGFYDGEVIDRFAGRIEDDGSIRGRWTRGDGRRTRSFVLRPDL